MGLLRIFVFIVFIQELLSAQADQTFVELNFQYVGGFCRSGHTSANFAGTYTAACSWDSPCTLEECSKLCLWKDGCKGFEYSFTQRRDNVTCELHETTVDYAKDSDINTNRCYRRFKMEDQETKSPSTAPTVLIDPVSDDICFEYIGGFCRYSGNPRYGEYEIGCSHDSNCSIEECERKCYNMDDCTGYEYTYREKANGVVCELHTTSIDSADSAPLSEDQCYRKLLCSQVGCNQEICPNNSRPRNPCVRELSDCECDPGYYWVNGKCRNLETRCFDYLGRFCRGENGNAVDFVERCNRENSCSLKECFSYCYESESCTAVEFTTWPRSCKLYSDDIHLAEGVYRKDKCFRRKDC